MAERPPHQRKNWPASCWNHRAQTGGNGHHRHRAQCAANRFSRTSGCHFAEQRGSQPQRSAKQDPHPSATTGNGLSATEMDVQQLSIKPCYHEHLLGYSRPKRELFVPPTEFRGDRSQCIRPSSDWKWMEKRKILCRKHRFGIKIGDGWRKC